MNLEEEIENIKKMYNSDDTSDQHQKVASELGISANSTDDDSDVYRTRRAVRREVKTDDRQKMTTSDILTIALGVLVVVLIGFQIQASQKYLSLTEAVQIMQTRLGDNPELTESGNYTEQINQLTGKVQLLEQQLAQAVLPANDDAVAVSNMGGSSVESPNPTSPVSSPAPSAEYKTYVVKPGDSLIKISTEFFGTDKRVQDIMDLNNIKNATSLRSGVTIKIPLS